jgi:hypothetical protein
MESNLWSSRQVALLTFVGINVVLFSLLIILFKLENLNDATQSVPGVSFVVDPATLGDCDDPTTTAKVSWNVAIASIERVDVFVLDENAVEKLVVGWREAVGSANTGPWVGTGTVFVLRDNDGGKQLAKFTVGCEDWE